MSFLLKLLGGAAGPYIAGGVAALLALALGAAQVQTLRLHHAKADLVTARSELKTARAALINPASRRTWQSEAATCTGALSAQNAAVAAQAVESARKLALAEKGRGDALAVAESYRRTAPQVRAYAPKGAGVGARSADVDAMILGDLTR